MKPSIRAHAAVADLRSGPGAGLLAPMLPVFAALVISAPAAGQNIPERFENLKVLPADISQDELRAVMQGFTTALGVRCQYCHVSGTEGTRGLDYRSDAEPNKLKARFMITMVRDLNDSVLPELPDRGEHGIVVECVTCHRGQSTPRTLQSVLAEVIEQHGADSAAARYRALREQYYGSGGFDFGSASLNRFATALDRQGRTSDALRMLELNLEFYPDDAAVTMATGDHFNAAGDTAKAVEFYKRTLELEPNNRRAQQALQRLGGGG